MDERINKGPKACTTCAKAKARCIPRPDDGDKCERCYRLNKDCASRAPAPPRMRKQPKRSKVAELEKRLDELSTQFDGSKQQKKASDSATPSDESSKNDAASKNPFANSPLTFNHIFPKREEGGPSPAADKLWPAGPWDSPWPLPGEAEVLRTHYLELYGKVFPFVLVPEGVSVTQLRDERPWLWKAVMMTACFFDGARQMKLGRELVADLTKAMVVDGARSLDLLQSLQMLVAWFSYALNSTQLTNLLFLARSMCVNLGLPSDGPGLQQTKLESLERLRAYTGTYYLNTLVFTTNKKIDAFMNTAQLDSCCRSLEAAGLFPSDEYLVKLVRIQQLAQSISFTMTFEPGQAAVQLPLTMVVDSFQQQLDSFKASLPDRFKGERVLDSHVAIAEVMLKEFAISDQHCSSTVMPLTDRLHLLYACMRSVKAFLTNRYLTSGVDVPNFICLAASDVAYGLIVGIRLVTLRLPGWNLEHIVTEMRLGEKIDHQILELVETVARRRCGVFPLTGAAAMPLPLEGEAQEDPFERWVCLLRNVRELLRTEEERKKESNPEGDAVEVVQMANTEEIWWEQMLNDNVLDVQGEQMSGFGFGPL